LQCFPFQPAKAIGDWDFEIYIRTEFTLQSQTVMHVYIIRARVRIYTYAHFFFMAETLDEIIVRELFKRKSLGCLIFYTSPALQRVRRDLHLAVIKHHQITRFGSPSPTLVQYKFRLIFFSHVRDFPHVPTLLIYLFIR
jgi:hypothetical protein